MDTQPLDTGLPSPAPTDVGPVWEADNDRLLQEAEGAAKAAKDSYFEHGEQEAVEPVEPVEPLPVEPVEPEKAEHAVVTDPLPENAKTAGQPAVEPTKSSKPQELNITNAGWMEKGRQEDPREKSKSKAKVTKDPKKELPSKPSTWGKAPYISPEEQCPPKKRGRKPKKNGDEKPPNRGRSSTRKNKKALTKQEQTRKRKAKPSAKQDEEVQEEATTSKRRRTKAPHDVGATPEHSTPSQRTRKYLQEQKAKQLAAAETKEKKKRKQPSTETDVTEKKAKLSRKSAAYHKAYKACNGTDEQKRIAAKKVL